MPLIHKLKPITIAVFWLLNFISNINCSIIQSNSCDFFSFSSSFNSKQQSITFASFLLCISLASAQLTYHLDANTNSYTLQTPNSQQTFTQHFNTRNGAANQQKQQQGSYNQIQAAASSQPQQQQQVIKL